MTEHIPVIVGAARTPTGKFLGGLAGFTAPQLGAIAIKEAVRRSGIAPNAIEEAIMGNVVSAGVGQAPARQADLARKPSELPSRLAIARAPVELASAISQARRDIPGEPLPRPGMV